MALTHFAAPAVLHLWRVLDAWTTAMYRSIQILREEEDVYIRKINAQHVIIIYSVE